ncbi:zinc carboxypeptidase family protein, partial [Vibrio parahaemolyticus V-223/04]
SKKRSLNRLQK